MTILDFQSIRKEVIKLRKANNITQKQLCKATNISQSLLSKFEKGHIDVSYDKVSKIYNYLSDYPSSKQVKDYVNWKVLSVKSSDSVKYAKKLALENNFSQLPVIDKGIVQGSVSLLGLLDINENKKVEIVMEDPFPIIPLNASIDTAKTLIKEGYSAVLTQNKKKVGIITSSDLL